jgi:putative FmdB family regulatory protein
MPIYEYACGACGHRFEEWQKMSDKPVRTCPKCKAKKVEKLISQTSFTLKGGGWYSDLYAGPKPGGGSKDAGEGSSSDSKDSAPKDGGKGGGQDSKETKETKDSKEAKPDAKKPADKASGKKAKTGAA